MSDRHHRIDYLELPVTDLDAAKRFYGSVFGWNFEDWGPAYASFKEARLDGGLRLADSGRRGGTLAIFYSDDLAATEKAVTEAGGQIVERHDFPGGRRFHFTDPSGNELAVWTET